MGVKIMFITIAAFGFVFLLQQLLLWHWRRRRALKDEEYRIEADAAMKRRVEERERIFREEMEAHRQTLKMHREAREILKDRPKKFPRVTPIRPVKPGDQYLAHPQIKRVPAKKPDLVEVPRPPVKNDVDDLSILIGLQGFGGVTEPTPVPEPGFSGGGGSSGGAGASASWEPASTTAPESSGTSNDVCAMPGNYSSGSNY